MKEIVIAPLMPLRDNPHLHATDSLYEASLFAAKAGITMWKPRFRRASSVHQNRNGLIAELLQSSAKAGKGFTHILFQDDDIVIGTDSIVRLAAHGKDIVGGLCVTRRDPPIPNARLYNPETRIWENLYSWDKDLVEVGALGTGLMLISREALEATAHVYLDCLYEREAYGMAKAKATKMAQARQKQFEKDANAWWFRWLPPLNGVAENGEDLSFCWMARQYCGIPTYVDTSVQPAHLGMYPYTIDDFLSRRKEALELAKAEGRYQERGENLSPIQFTAPTPNNRDLEALIEEQCQK